MAQHQDRYIPADNNAGWPVAFGIIALAIVCALGATVVYMKTYKHPTDVTWHSKASQTTEVGH